MKKTGVLTAGLALFAMFFGAGDLIWPLILGRETGSHAMLSITGFVITGASLPLLGLIAMMLFGGNYRAFFNRTGALPAFFIILIIQAILGPFGSLPRLFTLAYASIHPYLPEISLLTFSIIASILVLMLNAKKARLVDLLGAILTPILLLAMGAIFILGLFHAPSPQQIDLTPGSALSQGFLRGYNTLDMLAAFIFAPLVMSHFTSENDPKTALKKMTQASFIAAGLLSIMFVGLAWISSHYAASFPADLPPEQLLAAISNHLLGPIGGFISCFAVALACLTTAMPLSSVCSEYIKTQFLKNKGSELLPMAAILAISIAVASIGFMGIANMLEPVLVIIYPGLIVLSVFNIFHKLYEIQLTRMPVYAAFGISTAGYVASRLF